MTTLVKVMIERGATIPEVNAVIAADNLLASGEGSDHAREQAEEIIDTAAERYLGLNPYEGGDRDAA